MPASNKTSEPKKGKPPAHDYPFWAPRFWHGMRAGGWFKLLAKHRFRIHPLRMPLACSISFSTLVNSGLGTMQDVRLGRRIRETEIEHPPVFIIGHWRSGTTFLHELMVRDPQFAFPNTYECFAPSHFLISQWIIPRLVSFLMPAKRPMDNMGAGFDCPQEDEFALANLGCPTPYVQMVFPNDEPCFMELLDMDDVESSVLERWKHDLKQFVQALTVRYEKPVVLKSPPHTGRTRVLSEMFPGAKFVHIARHPEKLFLSTRRLWTTLHHVQGLQIPRGEHLDEYIFESFERMYGAFESHRSELDSAHLCDLRYEDLVKDPVGELASIYEKLDLGDFESVRSEIEACVAERSDYKPNRHRELEPEIEAELRRRWAGYYQRYGYLDESAS